MVAEQVLGELVGVPEAATRLGISQEAVRKRIQRGRLQTTPSPTGILVELPPDFLMLERRLDSSGQSGQAVAIVQSESDTVRELSERIGRLTAELAEARKNERAALRSLMRLSRDPDA